MKYEWKNLFVLGANFFSSNIKLSLGSVSYTHLDVYKRQTLRYLHGG